MMNKEEIKEAWGFSPEVETILKEMEQKRKESIRIDDVFLCQAEGTELGYMFCEILMKEYDKEAFIIKSNADITKKVFERSVLLIDCEGFFPKVGIYLLSKIESVEGKINEIKRSVGEAVENLIYSFLNRTSGERYIVVYNYYGMSKLNIKHSSVIPMCISCFGHLLMKRFME
jgi:hypothetical protein